MYILTFIFIQNYRSFAERSREN